MVEAHNQKFIQEKAKGAVKQLEEIGYAEKLRESKEAHMKAKRQKRFIEEQAKEVVKKLKETDYVKRLRRSKASQAKRAQSRKKD